MAVIITKSIGTAVGRDYATIQAFFTAVPADLVAVDQQWIGEVYIGELSVAVTQTLTTRTCDATRNVILRAAAGNGIADNPSKTSDPLAYNATKGAAIFSTVAASGDTISMSAAYCEVRGLQIKTTDSSTGTAIFVGGVGSKVIGNLIDHNSNSGGTAAGANAGGDGSLVENNVMYLRQAASGIFGGYSTTSTIANNTIYAVNGNLRFGVHFDSAGSTVKNNNIFGLSNVVTGAGVNVTNNATDQATISSGSGNLVSQLFTNHFVSVSDLRLKSTSTLLGAGVAITGLTVDVLGQAYLAPPAVGAYQYYAPPAPTVSGPPTIGAATSGSVGSVSVAGTAPASNGGSAITSYVATSSLAETASSATLPVVFTGLSPAARTFNLKAVNAVGTSAASAESNSITPMAATVPAAPSLGVATGGNTTVTVPFTTNADGGSAILDTTVTLTPGGLFGTYTGSGSGSVTISGATNGVAYTASAKSRNAVGSSVASTASNSVTPSVTNAVPTFPGPNIADISATQNVAITPIDVSSRFADAGDTKTYSKSPVGTTWPTGASINATTGVITCTATSVGTTTGCAVRDTDSAGQVVDSNFFSFIVTSTQVTFPQSGPQTNMQGGLRSGACRVVISHLTTDVLVAIKNGLTMTNGVVPTFTVSGPTAGVEYEYMTVMDANPLDRGISRATPV